MPNNRKKSCKDDINFIG